jgi:hypothetical protein
VFTDSYRQLTSLESEPEEISDDKIPDFRDKLEALLFAIEASKAQESFTDTLLWATGIWLQAERDAETAAEIDRLNTAIDHERYRDMMEGRSSSHDRDHTRQLDARDPRDRPAGHIDA